MYINSVIFKSHWFPPVLTGFYHMWKLFTEVRSVVSKCIKPTFVVLYYLFSTLTEAATCFVAKWCITYIICMCKTCV